MGILNDTKKVLGIAPDYTAFDLDIIMHVNSVFATLHQLGIGPDEGFAIEDDSVSWDAFVSDNRMNSVKTYVYLRVRMLFDPPGTSFLLNALESQAEELEWRLNTYREETAWVDPDPEEVVEV